MKRNLVSLVGLCLLLGCDLGKPLHLPEGAYDLVVRVGQKRYHWAEISVQGEQRYKAGATP